MSSSPQHVQPGWIKFAARLQAEARHASNRETNAIISVKVLVDSCGNPLQWITPDIVFLEPKPGPGEDGLAALLAVLT